MCRRTYLEGLAGAAGIVTVSATGQVREHAGHDGDPPDAIPSSETPPRRGESIMGLTVDPIESVRIGIVGLETRGVPLTEHLDHLSPEKAEIRAICDVVEDRVELIDDTWTKVAERDVLDLIFVFTNLDSHAAICTYCMEQGKHVATEVAAAEKQCWDLVDTAEVTQRNCTMLEQVNYGEEALWVLNMIRNGVFGDDLPADAAEERS